MRYLVTGGAGFIGSNTVDELVSRGHSVVVLDDLSSGKEDNLAEIRNKITFIKGSVTDIEVVRKAMHEAEYVLHLAARTSVPRSVKDPIETNRINVDGTLNVLVAAKEMKVKRLVLANLLAWEAPNVSGRVFNVGTGGRVSLNQVLLTLARITGKPLEAKYAPPREGDIRDSQADISRAREFLGYRPQVGFEEGLTLTFEWYRSTQTKTQAKSET